MAEGSYIQSKSGKIAKMDLRKGVYVLDVVFLDGETAVQGEVVVDSGAADNVTPKGILNHVEIREPEACRFVAADGSPIWNYGRKDIQFVPVALWEEEFGSPFQGRD